MATVRLETESIVDWDSFHSVCKAAFGFPEFYGMNMNAWIDCLTYIDEGDGMSNIVLNNDEDLEIVVTDSVTFGRRLPEISSALVECVDFVNQRFLEDGKRPRIRLKCV